MLIWIVFLCILVIVAAFVVLRIKTMAKPEISTVVGFHAPDGMDPLTAGLLIDGAVDTEDVTSMIYYFASKGYLKIMMEGDDVVLLKQVNSFGTNETAAAWTLFKGLFKSGNAVRVKDLECNYYSSIDHAKRLIKVKEVPMYEKKSVFFFFVHNVFINVGYSNVRNKKV